MEVTEAIKGVGDNLLSAESRANLGNAFVQCFTRLKDEGFDLDGMAWAESIRAAATKRA